MEGSGAAAAGGLDRGDSLRRRVDAVYAFHLAFSLGHGAALISLWPEVSAVLCWQARRGRSIDGAGRGNRLSTLKQSETMHIPAVCTQGFPVSRTL